MIKALVIIYVQKLNY